MGMAEICFEDIYLIIYRCDGPEWAKKLRQRMGRGGRDGALEEFRRRYQDNWQSVRPKESRRATMLRAKNGGKQVKK